MLMRHTPAWVVLNSSALDLHLLTFCRRSLITIGIISFNGSNILTGADIQTLPSFKLTPTKFKVDYYYF